MNPEHEKQIRAFLAEHGIRTVADAERYRDSVKVPGFPWFLAVLSVAWILANGFAVAVYIRDGI